MFADSLLRQKDRNAPRLWCSQSFCEKLHELSMLNRFIVTDIEHFAEISTSVFYGGNHRSGRVIGRYRIPI